MPERRLQEELDAELSTIERLERLSEGQQKIFKSHRRGRNWQLGILGAFAVAIGLLGWVGFGNRDLLQRFENDRVERSIRACGESNEDRIAFNSTLLDIAGFDPLTFEPTEDFLRQDPEDQAETIAILERRLRPIRVCTEEGIELYFNDQPGGEEQVHLNMPDSTT